MALKHQSRANQTAPAKSPTHKPAAPAAQSAEPQQIQRALVEPQTSDSADILALQRLVGNRTVQRLLTHSDSSQPPLRHPVQTKLTVGPAGDQYEQEADRVAAQVMSLSAQPAPKAPDSEADSVQRVEDPTALQRKPKPAPPSHSLYSGEQAVGLKGGSVDSSISTAIESRRGQGQALEAPLQRKMEGAFGADFSHVRVHTDTNADRLSRTLSARAFTTGHDLFFQQGEYNPSSVQGQTTIAHELTHVVQQTGKRVQRQLKTPPRPAETKVTPKIQRKKKKKKDNDAPPTPFAILKEKARTARASTDPAVKARFLEEFSRDYAPSLTGEIEYFQFLSTNIAYMIPETGSRIGANVQTQPGEGGFSGVAGQHGARVTDVRSSYSNQYQFAASYNNQAGLNAFLLLPHDRDRAKNAIVLFRGTDAGGKGKGKSLARGFMSDVDPIGVGHFAHWKGSDVMESWLNIAKTYNRITVTGHSLGGAFAQRFYIMANRKGVGGKIRLITFQSAAIDMISRGRLFFDDPRNRGAQVTHVGANRDIVQGGGAAYVAGETLKYTHRGTGGTHTQTALAEQQINRALDARLDRVLAVDPEVDSTNFGYHGNWAISILKGAGSFIAETVRSAAGLVGGALRTLGRGIGMLGGNWLARKVGALFGKKWGTPGDMGVFGPGQENRMEGTLEGEIPNRPLESFVVEERPVQIQPSQ